MELFKSGIGLYILYYYGDWFFSSQHWPWVAYVVGPYFVISVMAVCYFSLVELKKKEKSEIPYPA
jgi:hypothetical protein